MTTEIEKHSDHKDHAEHKGHDDHKDHDDHKGHDDHEDGDACLAHTPMPQNRKGNHQRSKQGISHKTGMYIRQTRNYIKKLEKLDAEIKTRLKDIKTKPFIYFHDAFQYFETTYGLNGVGTISVEPDEVSIAEKAFGD